MKNLSCAFLLATTCMTTGVTYSTPAEAGGAVIIAAGAAASSASSAAVARRRAENEAIANPSDQNIQKLVDRNFITPAQKSYVRVAIEDLNLPKGILPDQVTEDMRAALIPTIENKQLIDIIAQPTPESAVAKGLSSDLSPYFNVCKAGAGSQQISMYDAKGALTCMEDHHYKNDTKPFIIKAGLGTAGAIAFLSAGFMLGRRKSFFAPSRDI